MLDIDITGTIFFNINETSSVVYVKLNSYLLTFTYVPLSKMI